MEQEAQEVADKYGRPRRTQILDPNSAAAAQLKAAAAPEAALQNAENLVVRIVIVKSCLKEKESRLRLSLLLTKAVPLL